MSNLALAYRYTGQKQRAVALHEEVLSRSRRKLGLDHPTTLELMENLAESYRQTGQGDRAVPLFEEANALMKAALGPDHPKTLISQREVASVYQDLGKLEQAHVLIQDAAIRTKAALGRNHRDTLNAACDLADSYLGLGRLVEALEVARDFPDLGSAKSGRLEVENVYPQSVLGRIQLARKAWSEAEAPLRSVLAIREATIPNDWTTFNTRSLLGAALLGQKKYSDAEPLLQAGYEGMKARVETMSPARKHYLRDALDRLIEDFSPRPPARWRPSKGVEGRAVEKGRQPTHESRGQPELNAVLDHRKTRKHTQRSLCSFLTPYLGLANGRRSAPRESTVQLGG